MRHLFVADRFDSLAMIGLVAAVITLIECYRRSRLSKPSPAVLRRRGRH